MLRSLEIGLDTNQTLPSQTTIDHFVITIDRLIDHDGSRSDPLPHDYCHRQHQQHQKMVWFVPTSISCRNRGNSCSSARSEAHSGACCRCWQLSVAIDSSFLSLLLLEPNGFLSGNSKSCIDIEMLKDQEQELVRKKRDQRPQRNRSNHRNREYNVLDGLRCGFVSLDAPSRIHLVTFPDQHETRG